VASVSAAIKVVRAHPELRDQLWANVRRLRQGLGELGYVIGDIESPIVPILTGDEDRTIALWQRLLSEGLYVNLIVPPGCPVDACVLRASCSAAHTSEQLTRARSISSAASAPVRWASLVSRCHKTCV
jgi:8-amino-7-oxononanoate synthase